MPKQKRIKIASRDLPYQNRKESTHGSTVIGMICEQKLLQPYLDVKSWVSLRATNSFIRSSIDSTDPYYLLLPHQMVHVQRLYHHFAHHKFPSGMDASEMGTGKTYTACALARLLKKPMVVFGPRNAAAAWEKAFQHFSIPYVIVSDTKKDKSTVTRGISTFVSYTMLSQKESIYASRTLKEGPRGYHITPTMAWEEKMERGTLVVFDESHLIGYNNHRHRVLRSLSKQIYSKEPFHTSFVLFMSATPLSKTDGSIAFLKLMGIIRRNFVGRRRTGECVLSAFMDVVHYNRNLMEKVIPPSDLIHHHPWGRNICPQRPYMSTNFVTTVMQRNKYLSTLTQNWLQKTVAKYVFFRMDLRAATQEEFKNVKNLYFDAWVDPRLISSIAVSTEELKALTAQIQPTNGQADWLRQLSMHLQIIEMSKTWCFAQLATMVLINCRNSKVILVMHYINAIKKLAESLAHWKPIILHGQVPAKRRAKMIADFQKPNAEHRLIIGSIRCLGTSLDLDDQHGNWPRFMFICPSPYVSLLHQTCGRTFRANTKSEAIVRFVFLKDVPHEGRVWRELTAITRDMQHFCDNRTVLPGNHQSVYLKNEAWFRSLLP